MRCPITHYFGAALAGRTPTQGYIADKVLCSGGIYLAGGAVSRPRRAAIELTSMLFEVLRLPCPTLDLTSF